MSFPNVQLVGTASSGRAIAGRGQIGLERESEVHDLARRGPERAPFGRQGGDQHEPVSGPRKGWFVHRHRQGTRRVVEVNTQTTAGAPDGKRDGLTIPVRDGIGGVARFSVKLLLLTVAGLTDSEKVAAILGWASTVVELSAGSTPLTYGPA